MTDRPILMARDVSKTVQGPSGSLTILEQVDLEVSRGETLAIVGASGSGKTTLLGLLAGLDLPSSGEIVMNGQNLTELDEDGRARLRNQQVGFVFQSFHLLPSLTALENVLLPLELAERDDARARAREVLEQVGLTERQGHYPHQLSGGEQQRVAIARAFATLPSILFADEPTGNLDSRTGDHIAELLFDLNRAHDTTLVLVTHDADLAKQCDRTGELDYGKLAFSSRERAA